MLPSLRGWFRRERSAGLTKGAAKFVSGAKLHIVVVGDPDAGKTSLVRTLATEFFHTHKLAEVLEPLHIKLDTINGDEVSLEILDSESPSAERTLSQQHVGAGNTVTTSSASVSVSELGGGKHGAQSSTVARFGSGSNASTRGPMDPARSEVVASRTADAFNGSYSALRDRLQARLPVDAVVIAFDAGNDAAFRRLATHWLPHIEELRREFGVPIPVVVAENKIDVRRQLQAAAAVATAKGLEMYAQLSNAMGGKGRRGQSSAGWRAGRSSSNSSSSSSNNNNNNVDTRLFRGDKLSPGLTRFSALVKKFSGISACVACSSKRQLNISEVFRLAASAAMFPIAPLLAPPTSCRPHDHGDGRRGFAASAGLLQSHDSQRSWRAGGEDGNSGVAAAPSDKSNKLASQARRRKKGAKSCENPEQRRRPRAQATASSRQDGDDDDDDDGDAGTVSLSHGFRVALERVFRMADAGSCDGILDRSEYHRGIHCCFGQKVSQIGQDFWDFPPTAKDRIDSSANLENTASYFSGLLRSLTAVSTEFTATPPSRQRFVAVAPSASQRHPAKLDASSNGEAGITLKGWFYINRLFLERNRPEVPWRVLRAYGYRAKACFAPCPGCRSIEPAVAPDATSSALTDAGPTDQGNSPNESRVLGHRNCNRVFQMDVVLSERVVDERELRSLVARGCAIELSEATVRFLTATFQQFSSDGHVVTVVAPPSSTAKTPPENSACNAQDDECSGDKNSGGDNNGSEATKSSSDRLPRVLREASDLDNILRICPPQLPLASWLTSSIQDRRVAVRELSPSRQFGVTLAGWVSLWQMAAALHPLQTILVLRYLGVPDPRDKAIYVHFPSPQAVHAQSGLLKASNRRTLRCFVVGARGSGKTSLIERLCQRSATFDTSSPRKIDVEAGPRVPVSSAATDWDNAMLGNDDSLEGTASREWLRDLERQGATHQPSAKGKSVPLSSYGSVSTSNTDSSPVLPHVLVLTEVPAGCEDQVHMLNQGPGSAAAAAAGGGGVTTHETGTTASSLPFSPPPSAADLYLFVWEKQSMESLLYLKGLQNALRCRPKVPCLYVCCDFGDRTTSSCCFRSEGPAAQPLLSSTQQHIPGTAVEKEVQHSGESHLLSLLHKHRQLLAVPGAVPDEILETDDDDAPPDLDQVGNVSEESTTTADPANSQEDTSTDKHEHDSRSGSARTPLREISRPSSSDGRDEIDQGSDTEVDGNAGTDIAESEECENPLDNNEREATDTGNLLESSEDSHAQAPSEPHSPPPSRHSQKIQGNKNLAPPDNLSRHSQKIQGNKNLAPPDNLVHSVRSDPAIPASGNAEDVPGTSSKPEAATRNASLDGNAASSLGTDDASGTLLQDGDLASPDQASSDEFESVNEDDDDDDDDDDGDDDDDDYGGGGGGGGGGGDDDDGGGGGEEDDVNGGGSGDSNEKRENAASALTVAVGDEANSPDQASFDSIWSAAQVHCDEWSLSRPEIRSSYPSGDRDESFYGGSVPLVVAMTTSSNSSTGQPHSDCGNEEKEEEEEEEEEDLPRPVCPEDVFGAVVYFAHHPQLLYPRRRTGVQPSLWQRSRALRLSAYAAVATAATAACGLGLVLYLDKASAASGKSGTNSSRGESLSVSRGGAARA